MKDTNLKIAVNIPYSNMEHYLASTNWDRKPSKRGDIAIFHSYRNGNLIEIIIPLSNDYADYADIMLKNARLISEVEQVNISDVLANLLQRPSDWIRYASSSTDTQDGTINIPDGLMLFENARNMIYAAACDIISPALFHRRLYADSANEFINQCRFGQTSIGSFVASVICPFVNTVEENAPGEQFTLLQELKVPANFSRSFTRKVTTQVMNATMSLKQSIEEDTTYKITENETGILMSANFLESIVDLHSLETQNTKNEIRINSIWSKFAPVHPDTVCSNVSIDSYHISAIESMIVKMKPYDAGEEGEFVGRISSTRAEADISKRKEGEVVLNFIGTNAKAMKARVVLDNDNYNIATQAHSEGKNIIIKGLLKRKGKTHIIESPNMTVINN